jgi:hypothetical protein
MPCSHVTLFFLKRNSTPLAIFSTIASLRDCIFATSTLAPVTLIPWSARWCETFSYSSEEASSALDGMQPTLRHVPPSLRSPRAFFQPSMQAVLKPSCAARMAAM